MKQSKNKRKRAAATKVAPSVSAPTPAPYSQLTREQREETYRAVVADREHVALEQIANILAELRLTLTDARADLIGGSN